MLNQFLYRSADAAIATTSVLGFFLLSAGEVGGATLQLNSLENLASLEKTPTDSLSLPKDFITPELLSDLLVAQSPANEKTDVNLSWENATSVSDADPLSAESIIGAFRQLRFEREGNAGGADVPVLPQTAVSDVYEGIYGFSSTSDKALSEPFGSVTFTYQPPRSPSAPLAGGNVVTGGGGVRPPRTGIGNLSLPRFGGPLPGIGRPQMRFADPIRPVSPLRLSGVKKVNGGDTEIDVFFRPMPEQEVVNLDMFLRTIYRTSPSAMLEQLEDSLDLEVDVQFQMMPDPVFANPYKRVPNAWRHNL